MFWYLGTVYSKHKGGIEQAFIEASQQAAILTKAGIPVFSPIAHTHPIAIYGGIDPLDHEIWLEADRTLMEAARGMIVCTMDGWRESFGIDHEIKAFLRMGKPIIYMTPGVVPDGLLPRGSSVMAEVKSLPDSPGLWIEESKPHEVFRAGSSDFAFGYIIGIEYRVHAWPGRWLKVELPTFPPRVKADIRLCWATDKSGVRGLYCVHTLHPSTFTGHGMVSVRELSDIVWITPEFEDEIQPHK